MRALITGGAGFIGSHLAEYLLEKGFKKITIIDNLSTGRQDNIMNIIKNKNVEFVSGNIIDSKLIDKKIAMSDIIFHLAAVVGVKLVLEEPVKTIITNISGTERVLSIAQKYNKKVLIASTSEVYGKGVKVPFSENDDILMGPTTKSRWSYACSKAIDEFLALAYFQESKLPVIIVRLFNTVGPRQSERYGMVLPNFVKQALTGKDITVYGDGSQTRSFCHVKDVVTALHKLAFTDKAVGQVFNVGNDEEVSIKELAERVKDMSNSSSKIVFLPYNKVYSSGFDEIPRRIPDITKLKQTIGFVPKYSINDIIIDTINYYREKLDA
jgi:UDP-glucose 4-epimerase